MPQYMPIRIGMYSVCIVVCSIGMYLACNGMDQILVQHTVVFAPRIRNGMYFDMYFACILHVLTHIEIQYMLNW